MSNRCDNSGVMPCARIWSSWKPFFHISGHWENNMTVYSSHVCTINAGYLGVYPEQLYLDYTQNNTKTVTILSDTNWELQPANNN